MAGTSSIVEELPAGFSAGLSVTDEQIKVVHRVVQCKLVAQGSVDIPLGRMHRNHGVGTFASEC